MSGFHITGIGTALPDNIVTNDDLAKTLDTSDDWITERTGIKERRFGENCWELGRDAAKVALKDAGVEPDEIDTLILASSSPDRAIPATSTTIAESLGIKKGAFDINAACAGFVYGLVLANGLIHSGNKKILLIGAEKLTRLVDMEDRATAVLFGDGAGAVVLEAISDAGGNGASEEVSGKSGKQKGDLLGWTLSTDGSLEHILYCDFGGYIKMEGKEVFRKAVQVMVDSSMTSLEKAGLTPNDIDLLIPHQANTRIISAACSRLGIPTEKTVEVLAWTGNTSTASIPLALGYAEEQERLKKDSIILFVGFGAGMTAASAIVRWNKD